jgi:predicted hydrocarbon binding protein
LGYRKESKLAMSMLEELPKYGYGVPEMLFVNEKSSAAGVRIHNCFNALGYKNTGKPVCYMMEGILASLFEAVFRKKVVCRETKCAAAGSLYCEFKISTYNIPVKSVRAYPHPPKNLVPIVFKFNPAKGEIRRSGINSAIFPRGYPKKLEMESEKVIGNATRGIYYMIGRMAGLQSVGKSIPSSFTMKIIARFFKRKFLSRLAEICIEFGYGILEYVEIDMKNKRVVVRLHNSANAVGAGKSERPACYLLTGLFAGAADIIFGKVMKCEEVKCSAMGDPYCEFHVYPETR